MDEPSPSFDRRAERDADTPPSPLDPFVATFVAWLATREHGVNANRLGQEVADATGWHPAFAEAVVSAARSRGLISPVLGRGRRPVFVGLSRRGRQQLAWDKP